MSSTMQQCQPDKSMCLKFFMFETTDTTVTLPWTSSIDISPFLYSNADLNSGNKELMDGYSTRAGRRMQSMHG